ncbi:hypothetical protein HMPREF9212_0867 [Lactobacillus iners LactinV 03V1-b]|nr:hypothetical protein HMPREF9212_0867 [Lactobacillus iners LactinV 03V1-b]
MNAILTVYGQDKVGIIAQTSTYLAEQKNQYIRCVTNNYGK